MQYSTKPEFAEQCDDKDPLKNTRQQFLIPRHQGRELHYFNGNSLGLQPKTAQSFVQRELELWGEQGSLGYGKKDSGWIGYQDLLTPDLAAIVGASTKEVVAMNSLTVNLHLMMASFYRPTAKKFKILMEPCAFPSDQYAVQSQIRWHGYDPKTALVELQPRPGEMCLRHEDILSTIQKEGDSVALILMGHVQYLTGQCFDIQSIVKAGHAKGCMVGFDLAHSIGNVPMHLHDWDVDFAIWCSYKYLNSGPGAVGGAFVHDRLSDGKPLRLAGWWGQNTTKRFLMEPEFDPQPGAVGWQMSNSPILQSAVLRSSLFIFAQVGMEKIRAKSLQLTGYLEYLINQLDSRRISIVTPADPQARGAQLSLKVERDPMALAMRLLEQGVVCDVRQPNVIRLAPAPLYNSYADVYAAVEALRRSL